MCTYEPLQVRLNTVPLYARAYVPVPNSFIVRKYMCAYIRMFNCHIQAAMIYVCMYTHVQWNLREHYEFLCISEITLTN